MDTSQIAFDVISERRRLAQAQAVLDAIHEVIDYWKATPLLIITARECKFAVREALQTEFQNIPWIVSPATPEDYKNCVAYLEKLVGGPCGLIPRLAGRCVGYVIPYRDHHTLLVRQLPNPPSD